MVKLACKAYESEHSSVLYTVNTRAKNTSNYINSKTRMYRSVYILVLAGIRVIHEKYEHERYLVNQPKPPLMETNENSPSSSQSLFDGSFPKEPQNLNVAKTHLRHLQKRN